MRFDSAREGPAANSANLREVFAIIRVIRGSALESQVAIQITLLMTAMSSYYEIREGNRDIRVRYAASREPADSADARQARRRITC